MDTRQLQVPVRESFVQVTAAGDPSAPPVVLLHGWPQSRRAWSAVIDAAAPTRHVLALDLPGIGDSAGIATDGTKTAIADVVHEAVETLGLRDVTLVGHDAGGMVAYAYARRHPLAAVVVADVVVPGVDPWDTVHANPYIWHFRFHSVPELPETLVAGKERAYADWFFDALTADPSRIDDAARAEHAAAYATRGTAKAGFDWYRTFDRDAEDNRAVHGTPLDTPLLYVRGAHQGGDIAEYVAGFRAAGVRNVESALLPDAGHFTPEEAPTALWAAIRDFPSP